MNLITYQAYHFLENVRHDPKHQAWIDFYKIFSDINIGLSDRSGQIKFPIKTYVPEEFYIPTLANFNLSYKECCLIRAAEIIQKQESIDKPIYLMYSGGIDSSTILSSFIELLGLEQTAKRITVVMSKESLDENPYFWYKFIRPYFNIKLSDLGYNEFDFGDWIYVTGELNDQLFGSDLLYDVNHWAGEQYLNKIASIDSIETYFTKAKNISSSSARIWAELLIKNFNSSPQHNGLIWDAFWWYNFCWKWIYVYYRVFLFSKFEGPLDKQWLDNNYFPFFADKNFQLWSMAGIEPKHMNTIETYKITAKKFVCEVLGSNDYMTKTKKQSLKNIVSFRPRRHSITRELEIVSNYNVDVQRLLDSSSDIYG
jgi:hypothetical protein